MAGITDKEVKALIARAAREGCTLTQADGTIPGLTLSASKAGTGSWVLRYRFGGKQKEFTIGKYPVWGSADARDKAKELRRSVDDGVDIAIAKKMAKASSALEMTVKDLANDYFEKAEKEMHTHTLKQRKSIHERFVLPAIGSFKAKSVTPAHVRDVVKKSQEGGKTIPRVVLIHITQLFHHAVGNAVCDSNPCRDLKESAIVGKPADPKQRIALNAEELRSFLSSMSNIPRQYELALRLIILTGVRVGTLTEAKIPEFDLENAMWNVPHERRKNRRHTEGAFSVPLPEKGMAWVKELITLADKSEYLLPVESRRHTDKRNSMSKRTTLNDWMDRMLAGAENKWRRITPHDLRSTCKSWLTAIKIDFETRQRYLDHSLGGMDGIYDKEQLIDDRRIAANKWISTLNDIESGKEVAKVIKLPIAA